MLENLEILQFPDERLRRLSQPVVDFDQEQQQYYHQQQYHLNDKSL